MLEGFLLLVACGLSAPSQDGEVRVEELRVGHWVRVKGQSQPDGRFSAEEIEVRSPGDENEIIGTVRSVTPDSEEYAVLDVDGQPVFVGAKCDLFGVDVSGLRGLTGSRVEVEGYWRSPFKFSARELEVRDDGRDRLEGRIDAKVFERGRWRVSVMGRDVLLPLELLVEAQEPLASLELAPKVSYDAPSNEELERDDDDDIRGREVAPGLWVGIRTEYRVTEDANFNLDKDDEEDRTDNDFNVRAEVNWQPSDRMFGLLEYRHEWRRRFDEDDGRSRSDRGLVNEAYLYVRDVWIDGLDFQIGRQDFDETREWLYDENLDAVRFHLQRSSLRLEGFAATAWGNDNIVDRETDTFGAVLSTTFSRDWSVGAYAIRRARSGALSRTVDHTGFRALGEFVEDHESWAELAFVSGDEEGRPLEGWAIDVGSTWFPRSMDDWYFTFGFAVGSGDDDPGDGRDSTFRQTGIHDNNAKFGGVTSFRYYGELVSPELANLQIATLGVGYRFGKRDSFDIVLNKYDQFVAAPTIVDSSIDVDPSGLDRDLGWEIDLIYGSRSHETVDLEVVLGRFEPGDAFPDMAPAWLAKIQVRVQI